MGQFENLSIAELEKARDEIDALIVTRKAEAKDNLLAEFKQQAKDAGIDFNELIKSKNATSKSLPVKYRNPENKQETRTGRGHKPKWLKAKLDSGADLESFEV